MDRPTISVKTNQHMWRHSIRVRFLIYLLLTALVPLAVLFSLITSTRQLLITSAMMRQKELTRLTAIQVGNILSETKEQLSVIGALALRYSPTPSLVLSDLVERSKGFRAVYLFNAEDQMIGRASRGSLRLVPNEDDWTSQERYFLPRRGEAYYGNLRLSAAPPRLDVGLPLMDAGRVEGVIIAEIDLSELLTIVRNERIAQTATPSCSIAMATSS